MLHLYTSLRDFSIVIIDKVQCVHATSCQFKVLSEEICIPFLMLFVVGWSSGLV